MHPVNLPDLMRAVVWHSPGDLRVENRPVPQLQVGHALVAVTFAGMCATDRELVEGRLPDVRPGVIPGHEITGVVVACDGHDGINIGDRVVVDTVVPCDTCESCTTGRPSTCAAPGELGFTADGGWAQYVLARTTRLHRIPEHVSDSEAVVAEPFAMPLGALLDCGEIIADRRVLVVGGGIAAMAFASAALALGARQVQVCLRTQRRADVFRAIDPRIQLTSAELLEPGLADIGIDSVGTTQSIAAAMRGTRMRGLVICYGFTEETVESFPIADLVMRNLRLSGHTNPRDVWPTLISMLDRGSLTTAGLVDRVITVDEVPDAVAEWSDNLRTVIGFRETT